MSVSLSKLTSGWIRRKRTDLLRVAQKGSLFGLQAAGTEARPTAKNKRQANGAGLRARQARLSFLCNSQ